MSKANYLGVFLHDLACWGIVTALHNLWATLFWPDAQFDRPYIE